MTIATDPVPYLPDTAMTQAFSYLGHRDLAVCAQVKNAWRKCADDNQLWENFVKCLFNQPTLQTINSKALFRTLISQKLNSHDEIATRVQSFLDRIPLGENRRFRCSVGAGSRAQDQLISVEIKGSKEKVSPLHNATGENDVNEFDVTEYAMAMHVFSEGTLTTPPSPQQPLKTYISHKISHPAVTVIIAKHPSNECIQAVLRFPRVAGYSDLDFRLTQIIMRKVEKLSGELNRQNATLYTSALGASLLGLYTLSLAFG